MRASDSGLSLIQWRDSFVTEDPEDLEVFAKYCNGLLDDARFKRLLNAMEATALYNMTVAGSDVEKHLAHFHAIKSLRQMILGVASNLVSVNQEVADKDPNN
jgi:hypothetical protein